MLAQLILRAAKPCGADANYTNFFSHLRPVETQNLSKLNTMMLASMVEVPPNLSKILRLKGSITVISTDWRLLQNST